MQMAEFGVDREAFRAAAERYRAAEDELQALYQFIDSYPKYAWVKRWEEDTGLYTMLRFSRRYGLDLVGPDSNAYVGKNDFEFWPHDIAQVFYENDERVRQGVMSPQHPNAADVSETFKSPVTGHMSVFVGEKWAFEAGGEIFVAGRGWGESSAAQTNQ